MATVTIGTHTGEIPDAAIAKLEAALGRFPQFKGNLALWYVDWVKGTLASLAQAEQTEIAQAAFEDSKVEIAALFRAPKP